MTRSEQLRLALVRDDAARVASSVNAGGSGASDRSGSADPGASSCRQDKKEIAEAVGVTPATVGQYEAGSRSRPELAPLVAELLGGRPRRGSPRSAIPLGLGTGPIRTWCAPWRRTASSSPSPH
ncbi:helix-turn-helix domain-containing protein [Micromonospora sp. NBC_00389]|uniref:helix-turn-helix domain-containing protein n=1 Tax=Micromonospora sp. NBC_00389 TaxID=2903586 RepID=UPI003FA5AC5F